jgi:hypothetical protein
MVALLFGLLIPAPSERLRLKQALRSDPIRTKVDGGPAKNAGIQYKVVNQSAKLICRKYKLTLI